jgi:hypothetical protein
MANNGYVGYEYKAYTVRRDEESLYEDNLENYGWISDGVEPNVRGAMYVTLKFKRNRDIENRTQLGRLEMQFERAVREIARLEVLKKISASAVAYIVGIIGAGFIAGAILFGLKGNSAISIIFAVPSLLCVTMPYFLYVKLLDRKSAQVEPLINEQYNIVYETSKQAHDLL